MSRGSGVAATLRLAAALGMAAAASALPSCAALQEIAALRSVTFAFDRVTDLRVAGVAIGERTTFADLTLADAGRLAAAAARREVPLELAVHVTARNPAENSVPARLVDMGWALFLGDRRTVEGRLGAATVIRPGEAADVPVSVRLDLIQFVESGGAREAFDLALAFAGRGPSRGEVKLELEPAIETGLGPIRYPVPVVVRWGSAR